METLVIPKKLAKNRDLVVIERVDFERLTQENLELHFALKVILEGERALRQKKTRSLKDFLRSEFPEYAKDY